MIGERSKLLVACFAFSLVSSVYSAGMQCYSCSYNVLKSDGAVGAFLDFFNQLASDEHCKFEKDEDLYEINIKNCASEAGKVTKCSQIEGIVTTNIGGIFNIEVRYHTVTRECVLVDPADTDYTDGCHDHLPSYGPVRSVFQSFFGSTEMGEIEFDGKACYKTEDKYSQSKYLSAGNNLLTGWFLQCFLPIATVLSSVLWR